MIAITSIKLKNISRKIINVAIINIISWNFSWNISLFTTWQMLKIRLSEILFSLNLTIFSNTTITWLWLLTRNWKNIKWNIKCRQKYIIDQIFRIRFSPKINFQMGKKKKIYSSLLFVYFHSHRNNLLSIVYSFIQSGIGVNNQFHLHLIKFSNMTRSKTKPQTKIYIHIFLSNFLQFSSEKVTLCATNDHYRLNINLEYQLLQLFQKKKKNCTLISIPFTEIK